MINIGSIQWISNKNIIYEINNLSVLASWISFIDVIGKQSCFILFLKYF